LHPLVSIIDFFSIKPTAESKKKTPDSHLLLSFGFYAVFFKKKIFVRNKSVNQIVYELGFKYLQHFTRLFKKWVGQSPNEYSSLN